MAKLVSNANWDESDIKASIAALSFILTNSAKFNVESDTLANELQQLGLPKGGHCGHAARASSVVLTALRALSHRLQQYCGTAEHSISLCKSYKSKVAKVQERLREESLRGAREHRANRSDRGHAMLNRPIKVLGRAFAARAATRQAGLADGLCSGLVEFAEPRRAGRPAARSGQGRGRPQDRARFRGRRRQVLCSPQRYGECGYPGAAGGLQLTLVAMDG